MNARRLVNAIGAIGLLTLASAPTSAYICTGSGQGSTNEFQDADCDADEITSVIGVTFDDTLLAKDDDPGNAGPGIGGSSHWGALEVTDVAGSDDDTPNTVEFTRVPLAGIVPQVIVKKADAWYSVYDWQTQVQSVGGNLDRITREFPSSEFCDDDPGGVNCNAAISHVSAFGPVPMPAAVCLLGGGPTGLVGLARRKAA